MAKKYHGGKGFGYGSKLPEGTSEMDLTNPVSGMNWDNYPDNVERIDANTRIEDAELRRATKPKKLG